MGGGNIKCFKWGEGKEGIHEGWMAWTVTQKNICRVECFKEVSTRWQCQEGMLGLEHRELWMVGLILLAVWHCPHFGVPKSGTGLQEVKRLQASDHSIGWKRWPLRKLLPYQPAWKGKEYVNTFWNANAHVMSYQTIRIYNTFALSFQKPLCFSSLFSPAFNKHLSALK